MTKSTDFKSLDLSPEILANLESLGYMKMTPIQAKGLPFILKKKDFIGQANTGSGKTAAFALGILLQIDVTNLRPQALVIVPTRELAEQVAVEIRRLARFSPNVKVLTLAGGTEEQNKIKSLKQGAHIVVGTAGRLTAVLDKGTLNPTDIKILVLDEADRLLEMGSYNEINDIAARTRKDRQTMLFSATFPNGIKELSESLQDDATQVTIDSQHEKNEIEQIFYEVSGAKIDAVLRILAAHQPQSCMIFCDSRQSAELVFNLLRKKNISTLPIHADLDQRDRTLNLIKFANKSCRVLVGTDVAARGLDVKNVELIINFDLPTDEQLYVHRIGRSGRAGEKGMAISLCTPKDRLIVAAIGHYLKIECPLKDLNELPQYKPVVLSASMATLYISGGKKNSIRPGDILGALTKDAGLDGTDVGKIDVLDINSYVAIHPSKVKDVVAKLSKSKIKKQKFKIGKA